MRFSQKVGFCSNLYCVVLRRNYARSPEGKLWINNVKFWAKDDDDFSLK